MNTPVTTSKETNHVRTSHQRRVQVLYDQGGLPLAYVARLLGITHGARTMLVKRAQGAIVQHSSKQEEVSA